MVRLKGSLSSCPKSLLGASLGDILSSGNHPRPSFLPCLILEGQGGRWGGGARGVLKAWPQAGHLTVNAHRKKNSSTEYKFERAWILTFDRLTDVSNTFKIYGPNRGIDLHHLRFLGVFQLKRRGSLGICWGNSWCWGRFRYKRSLPASKRTLVPADVNVWG